MEKTLRPIIDKDIYSELIWKHAEEAIYETMFKPLFDILGIDLIRKKNDQPNLREALNRGLVQYVDGRFIGKFSAIISRELQKIGAKYDRKTKSYMLAESKIPEDVMRVVSQAKAFHASQGQKLIEAVNKLKGEPKLDFDKVTPIIKAINIDLEKQFKITTPKDLSVPAGLTAYVQNRLEEEYVYNYNNYLDKWSKPELVKLKQTVSEYVAKGFRADKMAQILIAEFGQSKRKAKFLARQETSLMVSKYREARYGEAGINSYKWSTSSDERVRPDHLALNGRVFRFDDPPITDRATGAKNNPGEDFNCRCVALPVYKEAAV